jgi:tetratricopeptide (TPR) repeat protein
VRGAKAYILYLDVHFVYPVQPVLKLKGVALLNLGNYEEAIKCYDKAIEIEPNNAEAWNNKGIVLGRLSNYEEAIACYDKAIELNPTDGRAWYNRAWANV